jgi:hypothetical protein
VLGNEHRTHGVLRVQCRWESTSLVWSDALPCGWVAKRPSLPVGWWCQCGGLTVSKPVTVCLQPMGAW